MKNDKTISDEPQGGGKHGEGKYLPKRKNKTWIVIAVIVAIIALTVIML